MIGKLTIDAICCLPCCCFCGGCSACTLQEVDDENTDRCERITVTCQAQTTTCFLMPVTKCGCYGIGAPMF